MLSGMGSPGVPHLVSNVNSKNNKNYNKYITKALFFAWITKKLNVRGMCIYCYKVIYLITYVSYQMMCMCLY